MQCDDLNWEVLNQGYCSYKVVTKPQKFCRNPYNLTGLCNRASCPLANSQYATVREEDGVCYLYIKVAERAHYPARMWERVRLDQSMVKAVGQISEHLIHWSEFVRQKCKARLVRIHEYLSRMQSMRDRGREVKIITKPRKAERRERRREEKALVAAKLDTVIEKELLKRLDKGYYGEIYNFNKRAFDRLVDQQEEEEEEEGEQEIEYEYEREEEVDQERMYERHFVEDFEESEGEDEGQLLDIEDM